MTDAKDVPTIEDLSQTVELLQHQLAETQEASYKLTVRVASIETAVTRLAGGEAPLIGVPQSRTDAAGDPAQTIAALRLELEGARRVMETQRRIANKRTNERDAAFYEIDRLKLELEELRAQCLSESRAESAGHLDRGDDDGG